MKQLLVLRHAKSNWSNLQLTDHERPLNKRGKRDAPRMGHWLRQMNLVPELILTSSAERALATAESVAEASGFEQEIKITRRFYHASPDEYIEVLNELDDSFRRVLIVGHNPGMEELVEQLTGMWERMPTAALALLELPVTHWRQLDDMTEARLVNLWRPKELPKQAG